MSLPSGRTGGLIARLAVTIATSVDRDQQFTIAVSVGEKVIISDEPAPCAGSIREVG